MVLNLTGSLRFSWLATAMCMHLLANSNALATDYFVSPNGNNSAIGSRDAPWRTIEKANRELRAGDTVWLRQGEYTDIIRPNRSGSSSRPIRYMAYNREKVVIVDPPAGSDGKPTAIDLTDRDWIEIAGLSFSGRRLSGGDKVSTIDIFALLSRANHNTIRDSDFQYANGYDAVRISGGSQFNRFLRNRFDGVGTNHIPNGYPEAGTDRGEIMSIKNGSRNLIQGNSFSRGGHGTVSVIGSYNVIRDNVFDGKWEGTASPGARAGAALSGNVKYSAPEPRGFNLFEFNIIKNAGASADNPDNPGMKIEGTNQIVRGNFYFDNGAAAVSGATRVGSIEATHHNRIYNNTFFNNDYLFVYRDYGNRLDFSDNVWKNNLIANHSNSTQIRITVDTAAKINSSADNDLNQTVIAGNLFEPTAGRDVDVRASIGGSASTESLTWWEGKYPGNFFDNRIGDVSFSNAASRTPEGFRVREGSAAVNNGVPLTRTQSSGDGNIVRVRDARYFYDGFNIPGETGDMVVVGNNEPVRIVAVDYGRNELVLEKNITWQGNAAVSLHYNGSGPDIGAYEIYSLRNSAAAPSAAGALPPPITTPPDTSSETRPLPPTITSVL